MKKYNLRKILLLLIVFITQFIFCQNTEYRGIVFDDIPLPIPEVKVSIKGTDKSTKTDVDGKFSIVVPDSLNILTFSFLGFETLEYKLNGHQYIEIVLNEEALIPQEREIWVSIGSFSDIEFAPYGISISNGQEEQNLLHFEDFQEAVSFKIALATDFNDNLTYETKFIYHNPLINGHLFNTSIEIINKDYSHLDFKDYNLSTKIRYLKSISSLLTAKMGVQEFKNKSGFGGAVGFERKHYLLKLQYGGQIGYWNDYFTYKLYLRKFFYKRKLSLIAKYDNINETNFFTVGIHYLFKTEESIY